MGLDGFKQVWIDSDKFRQVHKSLDRFEEVRIGSKSFGWVCIGYDMLGQVQIGLDRHTRTLNLITFSTLRNTEGVDVDIDKSCVFVMLHFFVLDAILSNSCRMGNFRSIQVLYRQKNHTMAPCIGSSSFLLTPLRNELLCQLFRALRRQQISANIKVWHPWQLKKSKSWGPFWSYQLNSTANPAHLPRK